LGCWLKRWTCISDATAYAIALVAIGRSALFKVRAATLSGTILVDNRGLLTTDFNELFHPKVTN
jgi:hypothetical protein